MGEDHANPYAGLRGHYPVVVKGAGRTAPGGYCPAKICWCGKCPWYVPLKPPGGVIPPEVVAPTEVVVGEESAEESEFDDPSN